MNNIHCTNPHLWQQVLSHAMQQLKQPHNDWNVRHKAMKKYLENSGTVRHEVSANLMARSLNHEWFEYLGHSTLQFEDYTKSTTLPLVLQPNGFFGLRGSAFGYNLMLPNARNTQIMVSSDIGYTLLSLSRRLSRRETKYRN